MTTQLDDFNDLYLYLRRSTNRWRQDSLRAGNHRCTITGNVHDLEVHHLRYNFKAIMRETFVAAGLPERLKTTAYTAEELNRLFAICAGIHQRIGPGVILSSRMHRLLHLEYGYGPISPEQFKEFKLKYKKKKAA